MIEGRFRAAGLCAACAAVASWFGLIHAWRFTPADTVLQLGPGAGSSWALGYGLVALILWAAAWLGKRPAEAP